MCNLCRNFGPEEKREKEGRKMIKDKKKCKSKEKEMQIRGRYQIHFFHVCEHKEEDKETELTKLELISGQTGASQAPKCTTGAS